MLSRLFLKGGGSHPSPLLRICGELSETLLYVYDPSAAILSLLQRGSRLVDGAPRNVGAMHTDGAPHDLDSPESTVSIDGARDDTFESA